MNPEDLRRTLTEQVRQDESEAEIAVEKTEAIKLQSNIVEEAKKVMVRWRAISPSAERRQLQKIYETMDDLVTRMQDLAKREESVETRELRRAILKEAVLLLQSSRKITRKKEDRDVTIEKGRREVVERSAAGAGENTQKRIRNELNYLIDHYSANNDGKIETLIDKWRRSGDPDYDPAIRLRFRSARKKKSGDDYAF